MKLDIKDIKETVTSVVEGLLKLGPTNLIGVDIGLNSVKIASVIDSGTNKFKLEKFTEVPLPEGSLIEDEIIRAKDIVKSISRGFKDAKISNKNICIGISGSNTITKLLSLSAETVEELEEQVYWESEQYIPFGVDEASLSYHVVGENEGGGTDVLVAAAKGSVIDAYKDLFEKTEFKLRIADLNVIALSNLYELTLGDRELDENSDGTLIFDFGAQFTRMIVYKKTLVYSREINIGGIIVTEEIQRQLGINQAEAEDLKLSYDENGNLPSEVMDIINLVLDTYITEIKKTIDLLVATSDHNFDHCLITGGASQMPGLREGLQELLGIDVDFFDPFTKLLFNSKKFNSDSINYISLHGGPAIGLAMRKLRR